MSILCEYQQFFPLQFIIQNILINRTIFITKYMKNYKFNKFTHTSSSLKTKRDEEKQKRIFRSIHRQIQNAEIVTIINLFLQTLSKKKKNKTLFLINICRYVYILRSSVLIFIKSLKLLPANEF